MDRSERRPWLEKFQLENYISENQFFKHFYISTNKELNNYRETLQTSISNVSVEIENPMKEMLKTVLSFKDLRERFIGKKDIKTSRQTSINSRPQVKKDKCFIL
jgi:hypothetical protein